jgi:hypothetical protein
MGSLIAQAPNVAQKIRVIGFFFERGTVITLLVHDDAMAMT